MDLDNPDFDQSTSWGYYDTTCAFAKISEYSVQLLVQLLLYITFIFTKTELYTAVCI